MGWALGISLLLHVFSLLLLSRLYLKEKDWVVLTKALFSAAEGTNQHLEKLALDLTDCIDRQKKVFSLLVLEERLLKSKRDLENPSTELADFLIDLKAKGVAFVRIDPDMVFLRSSR